MIHSAVLHYMGATQRSMSVVASIVSDLRNEGHEVTVLDVGKFSTINQDLPSEWIVRLLGHQNRSHQFAKTLDDLGATIHTLQSADEQITALPDSRWRECEQAIESELLTYFRRQDLSNPSLSIRHMRSLLTHNALAMYGELHGWLDSTGPNELLIPNGRTSRQKVARICAEELGISTKFYENGRARKNSYYLGKTQPHDRISSQTEVFPLTANMSSQEISEVAHEWLDQRMDSQSETNSFSKGWTSDESRATDLGKEPRAVFFTSSADEFLAFGPMWNIDSWSSQFEAFDLLMEKLATMGCGLILRVHPNLVGKSRRYFKATVREIRSLQNKHPSLTVFWHNSTVNSYDLVKSADYVFAERSTIGLEANLLGKPVWVNQAAQWDKIADVRQILSREEIKPSLLEPWRVDPSGAERFVAYWMLQEKPLTYSWRNWSSWEPEKAPLLLKIAMLFVRNPWFHRTHLLKLEWTRLLNRRFRDN